MNEVRVFDGSGKLKHIISVKKLIAINDLKLQRVVSLTGETRRIKFKKYWCIECRKFFKSNSTRGAKYCAGCRKKVYTIRKKNAKKEAKL